MVDVVCQSCGIVVDWGRADGLVFHCLEGAELAVELSLKEEEAAQMHCQTEYRNDSNRIHYLSALYRFLRILPSLEVTLTIQ